MPPRVAVLSLVGFAEAAGASAPLELENLAVVEAVVIEQAAVEAVSLSV